MVAGVTEEFKMENFPSKVISRLDSLHEYITRANFFHQLLVRLTQCHLNVVVVEHYVLQSRFAN